MEQRVAMQAVREYPVSAQKIAEPLSAKLDHILDLALKAAHSAEVLCDKIDGPRPLANVSTLEDEPASPPLAPGLIALADRIQDRLHRANANLERLHSLT